MLILTTLPAIPDFAMHTSQKHVAVTAFGGIVDEGRGEEPMCLWTIDLVYAFGSELGMLSIRSKSRKSDADSRRCDLIGGNVMPDFPDCQVKICHHVCN